MQWSFIKSRLIAKAQVKSDQLQIRFNLPIFMLMLPIIIIIGDLLLLIHKVNKNGWEVDQWFFVVPIVVVAILSAQMYFAELEFSEQLKKELIKIISTDKEVQTEN